MQCSLRKFAATVVFATGSLLVSESISLAQEVNPDQDPKPAPLLPKAEKDAAPVHTLLSTEEQAEQEPPYKPITLKQKYEYSQIGRASCRE